jgi:hypothetical protein
MDREPHAGAVDDRPTGKEGIVVQQRQSILVIDGLSETTEVLKAVFEPRGHSVNRVRQTQLDVGLPSPPNVVVWHANESDGRFPHSRFARVPRIVIGKVRDAESPNTEQQLLQPFHYGDLLHAIESALQTGRE